MYDGTLGTKGPWQALVTFQQMIILADKEGVVDMTGEALARRTTIPLEILAGGLAALEQPDPDSRSPDEEGRRIVRLSDDRAWGWRIVNYDRYRKMRSEEERREYHKLYARKRRAKESTVSTPRQQSQPIAVSRKQEVESIKQEAVDDAIRTASEVRLAERLPTDADRIALTSIAAAVPSAATWLAEANATLDGMHGFTLTPQQLGEALREYVGNGALDRPNFRHFRAYLKRAAVSLPEIVQQDDQLAQLERWARDGEAKERKNV